MTEDIGRSPDGSGSRPSDGAASTGVSPPDGASIPNAGPGFFFSASEGLRAELASDRSVELYAGKDGDGKDRWALVLENRGHVTKVGLSVDAMYAIVDMFIELAASGIAARSDETLQAAQPEGQEPGPKGDAQGPVS